MGGGGEIDISVYYILFRNQVLCAHTKITCDDNETCIVYMYFRECLFIF